MHSYYITGIAGSGKSTICNELATRGHTAQDTDDFGHWINLASRTRTERPPTEHDIEWYDAHKWVLPPDKIRNILAQNACKDAIFLCGTSSNDVEVTDLFDKVICLTIDPDTLVRRLLTRPNSDFGKSPEELRVVTSWHAALENFHRMNGALMIDGQQALDDVVDEIMKAISPPIL